jgi:cytochrome c oxidase cbb3-type subunit IV
MDDLVQTLKSLWGLWLMLIFVGIVVWVMWPGRKREMDDHARIPFKDPLDDQERKRDGRED